MSRQAALGLITAIIVSAMFWVLLGPRETPQQFGNTPIDSVFDKALNELKKRGVDVSDNTKLLLEPTTDCPSAVGEPCVFLEASKPVPPRSLSSGKVKLYINTQTGKADVQYE